MRIRRADQCFAHSCYQSCDPLGQLLGSTALASSGRFQFVLVTNWSDGNIIKMITGRNRKRMAEGILFSVCRTCNRYIISNNHPLDLFGEKTIREGIVRD